MGKAQTSFKQAQALLGQRKAQLIAMTADELPLLYPRYRNNACPRCPGRQRPEKIIYSLPFFYFKKLYISFRLYAAFASLSGHKAKASVIPVLPDNIFHFRSDPQMKILLSPPVSNLNHKNTKRFAKGI